MSKFYEKVLLKDLRFSSNQKFCIQNKEVERVDIIGNIVYLREKENFTTFQVDDLTGIIECISFNKFTPSCQNSEDNVIESELLGSLLMHEQSLKLGDLVNVRGQIKVYKNTPQINCNNIRKIEDYNEIWFRLKEIDAIQSL